MGLLSSLRPLWWVMRGWVWYAILSGLIGAWSIERFVPLNPITWLLLATLVALSISVGRGLGDGHRGLHRVIVLASLVALLWAPWATTEFRREVEARLSAAAYDPQYTETVVYEPVVQDGVVVDGIAVSNLFVYDADGEPLTGVQIFDDRGRAVQTTFDEGWNEWFLPGVDEPWHFLASQDADGRDRWNVYPLVGVPSSAWEWDDEDGVLLLGVEPRIPPRPFAKAPNIVATGVASPGAAMADDQGADLGPTGTP